MKARRLVRWLLVGLLAPACSGAQGTRPASVPPADDEGVPTSAAPAPSSPPNSGAPSATPDTPPAGTDEVVPEPAQTPPPQPQQDLSDDPDDESIENRAAPRR